MVSALGLNQMNIILINGHLKGSGELSRCTFFISENGAVEPEAGLSPEQLASEVKQLTRERDHLLAQTRKHSETLERKEMVVKTQYEEQLKESGIKISQV